MRGLLDGIEIDFADGLQAAAEEAKISKLSEGFTEGQGHNHDQEIAGNKPNQAAECCIETEGQSLKTRAFGKISELTRLVEGEQQNNWRKKQDDGKYAGWTGTVESNVYQRTVDNPDEWANGDHVMS